MRRLQRMGLAVAAIAVILDQISKPLMRQWLADGDVRVGPFISLISAWNKGVGFSLLPVP